MSEKQSKQPSAANLPKPQFEKLDRIARRGGPSVAKLVTYVDLEKQEYWLRDPGEAGEYTSPVLQVDSQYELDKFGVFDREDQANVSDSEDDDSGH